MNIEFRWVQYPFIRKLQYRHQVDGVWSEWVTVPTVEAVNIMGQPYDPE